MRNKHVKFGIFGPMYPPMDACLAAMPRAEKLGWDFIDYPDQLQATHPLGMLTPPVPKADPSNPTSFYSEIWYGSFEMMAAASVLTKNIELLLAVVDPLRRSPAVMAQEMATLAHMSHGRATFAIGAGEAKQFEPYGETRSKPFGRMEEAIRIWQALWASQGKPVNRESEFWPLKDAIFPVPLHEGKAPRLLAVGGGDRMERIAGELCDGWLTFLPGGVSNDIEALRDLIARVRKIASDNGRDPDALSFNAQVVTVIADTDEKAWELARHPNVGWIAITAASIDSSKTWEKWGFKNPLGDFVWSKDLRVTMHTAETVGRMTAAIPEQVTDFAIVWGNPERVAKRLQGFIDAGINEISFFNMAASADPEYGVHWERLVSDVLVRLGRAPLRMDK